MIVLVKPAKIIYKRTGAAACASDRRSVAALSNRLAPQIYAADRFTELAPGICRFSDFAVQ